MVHTGKLNDYIADLNNEAGEMFTHLVKEMADKQGVTEKLKVIDQMAWVGKVNNIRNTASEIVYTEMIYC